MISIPSELKKYEDLMIKTIKDSVKIDLIEMKTDLWDSKVCGEPYFPKDMDYPKSKDGKDMKLLAQINFSEVPHIEDYPMNGILQIFIPVEDDLYGSNFADDKIEADFKIIYHETVIKDRDSLITDFSFVEKPEYFPAEKEGKMFFSLDKEFLTPGDFMFDKIFEGNNPTDDYESVESQLYYDDFGGTGHKLGGYPFFTQTDPREYKKNHQDKILFLQLDTDDKIDMIWGDCGVANFFITKEDLKNKNFSNLLYNWDCY